MPSPSEASPPLAGSAPPIRALRWAPPVGGGDLDSVAAAFEGIARRLADEGLEILQERLYVPPGELEPVLAARRRAYRERDVDADGPRTVVSNPPWTEGPCAGIQILAVALRPGERVCTVDAGPARARRFESGTTSALFVADLAASPGAGDPVADLFDGARSSVAEHGLSLRDVARTWLYVEELIPTYGRLNRVRDVALREEGLRSDRGWELEPPASTGIQGWHPRGAPCFLDLLAVTNDGPGRPFTAIRPALQGEAWAYGSAFSRGMDVDLGGRRLATLSGTASIGPRGRTLHVGDPAAQIRETMANLDSLLDIVGADPAAGLWTLYLKDADVWAAWRALLDSGELVAPPDAVAIRADVCRDDLLFEAEVTVPLPAPR
jgi:enamine deaminase RidA (YjgF/YER057c/UK114 family)